MNNKNSFNHNNWLKNSDNITLSVLDEKGISVYFGKKGEINYRLSKNKPYINTKDFKSLENIFLNITGITFDLSDFYVKRKSSDE
ncbi:hypothetical protein [Aliarcobacter butzleri]|uniref:hypothetical protein n=1 Tax=Aliarcobacter butzleri TaxID=28197 RepID=UPI00263F121F|nr:hypothetical protein [Aliarcobacter butzleri]MDN5053952.1 hypothetical protein [Aliarcobacter butzleri]